MMNSLKTQFPYFVAKRALYAVLLVNLLCGTTGCRTKPPFGSDEASKSTLDVKLRPGLMLSMSVLVAGKKEIDEPAKQVSDSGTIVVPLLGKLEVSDMSLDDLRGRLTERYKKYYINPEVILDFVRDTSAEGISPWGFVTVLGRVDKPGRIAIPATRDMTVSGAIQKAGGFGPSAKASAILVTRTLPNGKTEKRTIDLYAVGAAGRLEEDIILEANDVVFVPEAMF
jgi:polysaccharide biosynthesis/export protein